MASERPSFWRDVRDSWRGVEHDYTSGSLNRAILLLAVPMVLEMAMESLFGIVNIFWVARLGAEAVAGVGLTESLLTIVYSIAMGVSMATTAMVARRTGERSEEGAARSAAQAILLGLLLALAVALPGVIWAASLLRGMGAEPGVLAHSVPYTRIMLGSAPSILLLFLMNAIFRGAGDAAIAMRVLWGANLLNMALDPLLIYGAGPLQGFGVEGAAIATAISRSFGVLLQLAAFARGSGRVKVRWRHFRPDLKILRSLSRISATGMLQFLISHASWVALVWVIARSGSVAVAGYTIAIRIVIFSLLPSWGLANAAATLVGQNLGARAPERAETAVWRTGLCNAVFLGAVGLLFIVAAEALVGLFTHDAGVIAIGGECLRVFSYGYLFYAYGMVLVQAFNGAGDTATPTVINLGCYWGLQIPLAWMLALRLGWGATGAFWAVPAAEGVLAIVGVAVFRGGRWKRREI